MTAVTETRNRVQSIDILRGIIMVIMALDHVRDFFHETALTADPTNLATTTYALFFTRWITHFCAPVFVFLAGTSAYLLGLKKTKKELSIFLIKRGLWLIVAEVVIVTLAFSFNPFYNFIFLQVIWVIGFSMILLGLLIHLPLKAILLIGLLIFFGHNAFDNFTAESDGIGSVLLKLFVTGRATFLPLSPNHTIVALYTVLPWTSVMLLGYCFGYFFRSDVDEAKRKKAIFYIGSGCIVLFIILRFINVYGDPNPWSVQRSAGFTFISFINTNKYPPSLLFVLMTLGPALIVLGLLETLKPKSVSFFTNYGRVPFFYFIVHFYLIHLLCVAAFYLSGYNNSQIADKDSLFLFRPASFGFNLLTVYAIWMAVVLIMYPLCKRYNRYKSTHRQWWLSYL